MRNGYKKTEIGVIPLDWEVVRLGDIATFYKGKGISKNDVSKTGIECIRYGELYTKYEEEIKEIFSKTNISKEKLFLSKKNDILIPASGETAIDLATASCVSKNGVALGGDINIIRTELNGIFLAHYLNTVLKNKIASLAQGSSVIHLYSSQLRNLYIAYPPLTQQKKIAKILSTTDNKIEAITKQIEKAEMVKKGLMQRLFSKKSKIEKLRKCTLLIKDGTHGTHKDVVNGIPLLSAKDIKNGKIFWDEKSRRISLNDFNKIHKNYFLTNGDLLLTVVGTLGRIALIEEYTNNYTFQRSVAIIRLKNDCSPKYFYYVFESNHFQKQLILHSNASAQAGVYLGELEKLKIPFPPLKEQQKIAKILTKADQKIEILKSKKEQYQILKTGLMQKLLTGEIGV